MRVFTAQFGLAAASFALVCLVADTAEAGLRRRRANNCNSCGTAMYAAPVGSQTGCGGCGVANGSQVYYGPNGQAYYSTSGYPNGTQPYYPNGITPAGFIPPAGVPNILPARATDVKARITDASFEPAIITIAPGTTVRWTNEGKELHTVTATKGDWTSGDLKVGEEFTATFTQPGTFEYYCKYHKEMKATVIVK